MRDIRSLIAAALSIVALGYALSGTPALADTGQAPPPQIAQNADDPDEAVNDPLEPVNRAVFAFN